MQVLELKIKILIGIILLILGISILFYKNVIPVIFINSIDETNTTYTYTKNNSLKEIKNSNGVITYEFDEFDRRVVKFSNNRIEEKYLWLENNKILSILDQNNNVKQFFNYKNKNDILPYGMSQNGQNYYFIFNKMKSLKIVFDEKKNIVKILNYDDNGNIIFDDSPEFKIPFGFAGGLYDKENKLLYFKEGIYNTQLSKWLTRIKKYDILENIKQLNSIDKKDVYQCANTIDTYYHSYLCAQNECGGLYASSYLEYFNGKGEIIDNSYYFNKKNCKKIEPSNNTYNKKIFATCVNKMIQPNQSKTFDALSHNCHDEVKIIINSCIQESLKKENL